MTDILKELFDSPLYIDRAPSEELLALRAEESKLWDKIQPLIGLEIMDELNDVQAGIDNEKNLTWFREGFRLGAGLILELL